MSSGLLLWRMRAGAVKECSQQPPPPPAVTMVIHTVIIVAKGPLLPNMVGCWWDGDLQHHNTWAVQGNVATSYWTPGGIPSTWWCSATPCYIWSRWAANLLKGQCHGFVSKIKTQGCHVRRIATSLTSSGLLLNQSVTHFNLKGVCLCL